MASVLSSEQTSSGMGIRSLLHLSLTYSRFGPSLPHDSVLTVLRFFGMPEPWITFMINASLLFDPTSRRTLPLPNLRRLLEPRSGCLRCGLEGNAGVRVSHWHNLQYEENWRRLRWSTDPPRPSCWSLWLSGDSLNLMLISTRQVSTSILPSSATKSVFGFVNAYNKYLRFFQRNFGAPAQCFGRTHADEYSRFQKELFPETGGNVAHDQCMSNHSINCLHRFM